jgi:hypothetical protein
VTRTALASLALACLTSLGPVWAGSVQAQEFSSEELARRTIARRAVEAVIWGMPAVNYDLMLQEMPTKTAGKVNQVIYWGRPLDWRNQTLTPNPDTLYFMAFLNTKDVGPIVIDVPPAGAGGSLTIHIAHEQPADAAARANWLPAPEGRFTLIIRAYVPTEPILDGSYKFPDVKRAPGVQ